MIESDARALIDRFNRACNERDLEAALAMTVDDTFFESAGPSPDGVEHRSVDALRAAWAPIFDSPASHSDIEELVVLGDRVVASPVTATAP